MYADRSLRLATGKAAQINFLLEGQKDLENPKIALPMELVVTRDASEPKAFVVQSLSFFDMHSDN